MLERLEDAPHRAARGTLKWAGWLTMTLAALAVCVASCDKPREPASRASKAGSSAAAAPIPAAPVVAPRPDIEPKIPFRFQAAARVVAVGDVHGDYAATLRALRLAGAVDEAGHWVGGELVVVQTGDQLDRGDDERKILDWFDKLTDEAAQVGGAFHALLGNHETMNAMADFRYVTQGGFRDFADVEVSGVPEGELQRFPASVRGRARAFLPGGVYAEKLARRNTVAIVGDTVFVHGGVLPEHVSYGLGRLNEEVREWLSGKRKLPPAILLDDDAPVWSRDFSDPDPSKADCDKLGKVLTALSARRMVMGHTVQKAGVSSACDGRAWRIDVGLAAHYGSHIAVLEIRGDQVRALTE
ncbi:MAG: metallophosphoesterase [Polyangiaceae bacterium]|nr:metallophosphoesterase [Polyangiaceae bacterium]MCW5789007.1 metallophosphoesterase [Polyangiaceae bacterium]